MKPDDAEQFERAAKILWPGAVLSRSGILLGLARLCCDDALKKKKAVSTTTNVNTKPLSAVATGRRFLRKRRKWNFLPAFAHLTGLSMRSQLPVQAEYLTLALACRTVNPLRHAVTASAASSSDIRLVGSPIMRRYSAVAASRATRRRCARFAFGYCLEHCAKKTSRRYARHVWRLVWWNSARGTNAGPLIVFLRT